MSFPRLVPEPQVFVGPFTHVKALALAHEMLDSEKILLALTAFLSGDSGWRDLLLDIQALAENIEARNPGHDPDDVAAPDNAFMAIEHQRRGKP